MKNEAGFIKTGNQGSIFISSLLFICCVALLWVYVVVLPPWVTDPYTYSAYKKSKQVSAELNQALLAYAKVYGMANKFSDFSTVYATDHDSRGNVYSFDPLISKGVKVGGIDSETLRFNDLNLDSTIIEVNWIGQNVIAKYKLEGNELKSHVQVIFNMGEVIEEDLINDSDFSF